MSLLEQVKGISSAVRNNFTVIIGKPGSAKTTSVGTYPKPILYIEVGKDGGGEVLKGYSDKDIRRLDLSTVSETGHLGKKLLDVLKELESTPNHGYKTVVIDAYSSIEEDIVSWMEKSKGKALSLPERGSINSFMLTLRDKIVDLSRADVEYVAICHVKTKKNTDTTTGEETIQIIPKMSESNGNNLLERASNVMYACRRTVVDTDGKPAVKFLMYIGAHPNMDTKLRLTDKATTTGTYIENFTFDKLEEIRSGKKQITEVEKINVIENAKNPFEDEVESKGDNW